MWHNDHVRTHYFEPVLRHWVSNTRCAERELLSLDNSQWKKNTKFWKRMSTHSMFVRMCSLITSLFDRWWNVSIHFFNLNTGNMWVHVVFGPGRGRIHTPSSVFTNIWHTCETWSEKSVEVYRGKTLDPLSSPPPQLILYCYEVLQEKLISLWANWKALGWCCQ
jgi:hypothetical protein